MSHGPKRCHCSCHNEHDEKYKAMFKLLRKAKESSKRMEMWMVKNQKTAFEQVEKALESYSMLSKQIMHTIVNIGSTHDTLG